MADGTPDVTAALLRALQGRTKTQEVAAEGADTPARWSYREAAAVLHCFHPARLRPLDARLAVPSARGLLFGDTLPAVGGRGDGLYTLKPEVRRAALRRLGSRERMRKAVRANPDRPRTGVQEMLEAWLAGSAPPLSEQSNEELNCTLQVVAWLEEIVPGLPPGAEVRRWLDRRAVVRPFEHLVSHRLVGRDEELQRIREYVAGGSGWSVLPELLRGGSLMQRGRELMRAGAPLLSIHGPGGIGKSALIGRFLLDNARAPEELRVPFAYLAFDSPVLSVTDSSTLLVEAADQLRRQYPQAGAHDEFRDRVAAHRRRRELSSGHVSGGMSRGGKLEGVRNADHGLAHAFGELLDRLAGGGRPALLVLDTFEEVQYRPREEMAGLDAMLEAIREGCPELRILISGRAPAEGLSRSGRGMRVVALEGLGEAAAVELLKSQGIQDERLALALVRQLGSNPLTLMLAARAAAADPGEVGEDGVEGVATRRLFFFSVPQELIRGQLYRRVLGHIHDEDVRKLAHPGMVLRRVTPDAIREVLSGPCEIDVPSDTAARHLFDELRREHALVRLEDAATLQYRPEIRQPMLRLLEREKPAQVRQIHLRAADFWARHDGAGARAEELYHRLALDAEPDELGGRWMDAAGPLLAGSLDELPPRAAAWLASHAGLRLDPEVRKAASLADWERTVGREVSSLLRFGDERAALKRLGERKDRSPGSALYSLEARTYLLRDDYKRALKVLHDGLESMPITGNPGRQAEMLWLRSQAEAGRKLLDAADATLARAHVVAREIPNPLCRLQVLAQRLLLRRRRGAADAAGSAALRDALAQTLLRVEPWQASQEPVLVGIALSELSPEHVAALRHGLSLAGSGLVPGVRLVLEEEGGSDQSAARLTAVLREQGWSLDAANLAGIEDYREAWEKETPEEAFA